MNHPNTGTVYPTNAPGWLTRMGFKVRRLALMNVGRRKGLQIQTPLGHFRCYRCSFRCPAKFIPCGQTGCPGINLAAAAKSDVPNCLLTALGKIRKDNTPAERLGIPLQKYEPPGYLTVSIRFPVYLSRIYPTGILWFFIWEIFS